MLTLYTYFRSSAAYRVRIALAYKGLAWQAIAVHLLKDGGEQHSPSYRAMNPMGRVPTLIDEHLTLSQSLAILEYLEEKYPQSPLLPTALEERAWVRQIAQTIACDIHPLNNLSVLQYCQTQWSMTESQRLDWMQHWMRVGFTAIEQMIQARRLAHPNETFCLGHRPTFADCCLVPQVFNAQRWQMSMNDFPLIQAIAQACNALPAFQVAHPEQQLDSPQSNH